MVFMPTQISKSFFSSTPSQPLVNCYSTTLCTPGLRVHRVVNDHPIWNVFIIIIIVMAKSSACGPEIVPGLQVWGKIPNDCRLPQLMQLEKEKWWIAAHL